MAFYLYSHRDLSEGDIYHKIELYVSDIHNLFLYSVEIEWGIEKSNKQKYYDSDKPNKELAEEIKDFFDQQIKEFYGDIDGTYGALGDRIKLARDDIHRLLSLRANE